VTNVPAYCLDEVAEHALGLLFALARKVCAYDGAVRRGDWALSTGAPIFRIAGRTLGIVGLGKIGRTLAHRARALGLEVVAFDPHASEADVEVVTLEELAERSDFVSVHTPLTPETHGLIGEAILRRMKPTAF